MPTRLLILAGAGVSAAAAGRVIDRHYGDEVEVHIVAPATGLSRLNWLVSDEDRARADAEVRAGRIAQAVRTDAVETEVGDTDPVQAVEDALATFDADEIVVLTCPDDQASWLEQGATEAAQERFDRPVRHLIVE